MAKYIIPPKGETIVRCWNCGTLYVPEARLFEGSSFFEKCPCCGYSANNWKNTIPLWKYNLIKLFRKGFKSFKGEET